LSGFPKEDIVPNNLDFTFSDLIAGYVVNSDPQTGRVELNTSDGRPFLMQLTPTTTAEMVRNLGDAYVDATTQLPAMLEHGRLLHVYGVFYPSDSPAGTAFEAKHVLLFGKAADEFKFESPSWWGHQVRKLADFYLDSEFGIGSTTFDYRNYRTDLTMEGTKTSAMRQETDTISRLVYGLATAYLMNGNQRYRDAAVAGAAYLIEHLCFVDRTEQIAYWYHALVLSPDGSERKVFASEFGDDFDAIPCYEQVYALAGLTQVFRITGDPKLREIIDLTINLFHRHFEDKTSYPDGTPRRGYYSHIDPVTLDPLSPALDDGKRTNRDRKNWNSVGDHIPAYLINLFLATGDEKYADELESLCDQITQHFPDYDSSPFVQEKFFGDWSPDRQYGQQQDRAIVGHNLKIAWNLTRVNSLRPKAGYVAFAKKIAEVMPTVGMDAQRGGWYDMMERHTGPGERFHRLVWHDRKAWWQQEQGILAYQILNAVFGEPLYAKYARESSAFYNGWMLDAAAGGVFFNVLANGNPFILGGERSKGSHSMAMYHSAELGYLAAVYSNLETQQQPMDLFFAPEPGAFGGVLRVAPDLLPPKAVKIMQVWVNGHEHADFDAEAMTVTLPHSLEPQAVRVRLVSASCTFSADTLDVSGGIARITLAGSLSAQRLGVLREQLEGALDGGARTVVLETDDLVYLDPEAVRYLAMAKQHRDFRLAVTGAHGQVAEELVTSELNEELAAVGDPR
jgi:mannose/cellobiose epimerase-like protein (N-acyl-D-glucosamine 2-epimerase family)/anti-anti-sigma regulatory factor